MKKLIKILPIIMAVMMVFMTASPVFASGTGTRTGTGTGTGTGTEFDPSQYKPNRTEADNSGLRNTAETIVGYIQVIGTIAAIVILMVVGIKYMMGSAEQKAEYKKVMLPYIIGAIILLAASNVIVWINGFANGLFS